MLYLPPLSAPGSSPPTQCSGGKPLSMGASMRASSLANLSAFLTQSGRVAWPRSLFTAVD